VHVSGPREDSPFDDAFLASLPRLEFAAARLRAREGDAAGRRDRRGGRVEFADHRAYVPGDDPRHLDWMAYARSGRLYVKEFEHHDEMALTVLVDDSASMSLHGKLRAAQRLAYAVAFLALAAGHRVRVGLGADGALRLSGEVAGRERLRDLGSFLLTAHGRGRTELSRTVAELEGSGRAGRILVLISDLWATEDGRAALAARARRGEEVDVLHLVAAADVQLPAETVVAEDVETGERRVLAADASSAGVVETARREADWRAFAARHEIAYVPLDPGKPTEELVLRTLRDAGVLR
jgi:uncharacterized protein (DUF58 family)